MIQWIGSSSVLIVAWLLLRKITWGKVSRRLQYALCIMLLIRLLVPFNFTLTKWVDAVPQESSSIPIQSVTDKNLQNASDDSKQMVDSSNLELKENAEGKITIDADENIKYESSEGDIVVQKKTYYVPLSVEDIAKVVWYIGVIAMMAFLIISNMLFYLKLRKNRVWLDDVKGMGRTIHVYHVNNGKQPFLFGIFKPAIYLNRNILDEEQMKLTLEHEIGHLRQLDPMWNVLRAIAVAIHWFNPLVWVYCRVAKEDAEYSCDEQVLGRIGEEGRVSYGELLLQLATNKNISKLSENRLLWSEMIGRKKMIRKRIEHISNTKVKNKFVAICMVVAMLVVAVGCQSAVEEVEKPQESTNETTPFGEETTVSGEEQDSTELTLESARVQAEQGNLYDLTDILKEMGLYDQVRDNVKDVLSVDGKIYGINASLYAMGVMYRVDLLKQAGFVDDQGNARRPSSWKELAEYASKLKKETGAGFAFSGGDIYATEQFLSMAAGFGVEKLTKEDADGKITGMLDSKEMIEAMEYLASLQWEYDCLTSNSSAKTTNMMTGYEDMANKKASMYMGANDALQTLETYGMKSGEWGFWALPQGSDGKTHVVANGRVYAFPKEESKDTIVKKLTELKEQGLIGNSNAFPLAVEDKESLCKDYVDAMDEVVIHTINTGGMGSELYMDLTDVINKVLTDKNADVEKLLKEANENFTNILNAK